MEKELLLKHGCK